jgi:hypothetical protein
MKHIRNTIAGVLLLSGTALAGDATPAAPQPVVAAIPAHARLPHTNSGPSNWSADAYQYDASGNIIAIGQQAFIYDHESSRQRQDGDAGRRSSRRDADRDVQLRRLRQHDGPHGRFVDDPIATDVTTNRLTAFSAQYNAAGI